MLQENTINNKDPLSIFIFDIKSLIIIDESTSEQIPILLIAIDSPQK